MTNVLKPLIDNGILTEDTQKAILEAWDNQILEAKEKIRQEVREEFAERHEHDKQTMVEALDRMVTETLAEEIQEFREEKARIAEDRVKIQEAMQTKANQFMEFLTKQLAEEINQFRADRKQTTEATAKLENFVIKTLAEELGEFAHDKRQLVETRIRLISEANQHFDKLKNQFVKQSSKAVSESVAKHLNRELKQLHEDINAARKNAFGRKIYEAFVSEYAATQLNENAEVRKLKRALSEQNKQLAEAKTKLETQTQLTESKDSQIAKLTQRNQRDSILNEVLSTLVPERREIMRNLLESVQTSKLKTAFNQYLPAVLSNSEKKVNLTESKLSEITGNQETALEPIDDIIKLAGIK